MVSRRNRFLWERAHGQLVSTPYWRMWIESHAPEGMRGKCWGGDSKEQIYRKLFDLQFFRYGRHGYFRYATPPTRETFQPVALLAEMVLGIENVPKRHIPFLLVNRGIPIETQVEEFARIATSYGGRNPIELECTLDFDEVEDPYDKEIVGDWYILVDVEIGRETEDVPPLDALEQLREKGRHPLDIYEGIALSVCLSEEIMDRVICLPGSLYRRKDIPNISFTSAGLVGNRPPRLRISYSKSRTRYERWGVASYRERIVLPPEEP